MTARRVLIDEIPFAEYRRAHGIWRRGHWPAQWIAPTAWRGGEPLVFACRLRFQLQSAMTFRAHVSADERYALFIDGELVGRGSERGDLNHWYFETYDVDLSEGAHNIVALVWALGDASPRAQISAGAGFLFAAEDPHGQLLSTGRAPWEMLVCRGVSILHFPGISHDGFTGKKLRFDGGHWPWGVERGEGEGWSPAVGVGPAMSGFPCERSPGRSLIPAALPAMHCQPVPPGSCRFAEIDAAPISQIESASCDANNHAPKVAHEIDQVLRGRGIMTIPPDTRIRAIIDLNGYHCAYPELTLDGGAGALVRLSWAESLYVNAAPDRAKGDRNGVEAKFFRGFGDEFICDGGAGRVFRPLWWQAGRYLQLYIETARDPLQVRNIALTETRFPLNNEGSAEIDGPNWSATLPNCRRAIEVGTHEVLTDSPYYEQLAYVGDARLAMLCHFVLSPDDRMARKTIELFDASRLPQGLTQSRYPCKMVQLIPGYSLLWIEMVRDLYFWRGAEAFVRDRLPGCRAVLAAYARHVREDGLLSGLPGWMFVDWSPAFVAGEVPGDDPSVNSIANLQYACALNAAAELERRLGIAAMADHYAEEAQRVVAAVRRKYWDESHGLFADDPARTRFSEHAAALAVLSGLLEPAERSACLAALASPPPDMAPATVYFTHYVIEALRVAGDAESIGRRLAPWAEFARNGLCCTPEGPEPARSDCHAWSAHPLFHAAATIAGIRPAEPGFAAIEIRPIVGPDVTSIAAVVPHPRGRIEVNMKRHESKLKVTWRVPAGIPTRLVTPSTSIPLSSDHGETFFVP